MKARKNKIIFAVMVVIILILCLLLGIMICRSTQTTDSSGGGIRLEEDAEDWNKELENASGDAVGIQIPGYGEITVTEGSESIDMSLVNPEENPCYFQFTLTVTDDNEEVILYESELVEPGKAVKTFDVENLPEAGDYDMTIKISTYSLDDGETRMNGAEVATILHVMDANP